MKKIIKPNGLVLKKLSTIKPIPTPTTSAAMISVLILNANPAPVLALFDLFSSFVDFMLCSFFFKSFQSIPRLIEIAETAIQFFINDRL